MTVSSVVDTGLDILATGMLLLVKINENDSSDCI